MDPKLFSILILRSVGMLANLQGKTSLGISLGLIADASLSGVNIDAHMQTVADALANGQEPDLNDLRNRIETESNRLQA